MTHTAHFGDAEQSFDLPGNLLTELERLTASGVGALCKRVFAGDFKFNDLIQTIRLGLIGAGMSPKDAGDLIAVYADKTPVTDLFPLAVAILELRYFGTPTAQDAAE